MIKRSLALITLLAFGHASAFAVGPINGGSSGSGATIPSTSALLKGDGAGNGIAATSADITDGVASLLVKPAVAVVATSNLTLSGEQTIDGVTTVGSLVLATGQTTGSQNGPWVSGSGAWTRPTWYTDGSAAQAPQFLTTFVRLGSTYQGSTWRMTTAAVTIGTTSTTWVQTPTNLNSVNGAIAESSVTSLVSDLALKSPLAGPTFTGTVTIPSGSALGTPTTLTLTNATGLPIAGLTASTSTALGVGSIELGAASDTTLSRSGAGALAVEGTNVLLNGGALGTPSSGTLTNATGLPVAGITASTSTALGVGSIELGAATDTTLSRSGAGALAVEGTNVLLNGGALGTPSSATLTNATAASDGVTGAMSGTDHTNFSKMVGQASGVAPVAANYMPCVGYLTGVDLKTNAATTIFTVPAAKNFVALTTQVTVTAVTGAAAVSFVFLLRESSANATMTASASPGSTTPTVGKVYISTNSVSAPAVYCAAGNNVVINITTAFTTSTTCTGTVAVYGYYVP